MDKFRRSHWYFLKGHEHFYRSQHLTPYHIGCICKTSWDAVVAWHEERSSTLLYLFKIYFILLKLLYINVFIY